MRYNIDGWNIKRNLIYNTTSNIQKIALSVLENGLTVDKKGMPHYDSNIGKTWVEKLVRDLDSISRSTIIKGLDSLFDSRILVQPMERILELVDDNGTKKYVRTFAVSNEYKDMFIKLYQVTHDITSK